ncbi:MAG: TGS domain-containing protein [Candidatus Stahlbacteria bacterium]|nr:TGS domain-containing protein [Candidatus Stahlbacteria bacterium]
MPANLPPQYFEAEKRFRTAITPQEKIAALREMLGIMPHHKGTDGIRAELNTKIAKLNKEMQKKGGTRIFTYSIRKEGAAQVLMLGLTNSGKSNLLSILTNSTPEIAPYPFTTITPAMGMMPYENIQIQIVELPALTHEFTKKWLSSLVFSTDLLMFIIDLSDLSNIDILKEKHTLFSNKKSLIVGNKIDLANTEENLNRLKKELATSVIAISCVQRKGIEDLKQEIYNSLSIIRVYTKEPGKEAELNEPIILSKGSTILEAAREIHKDFANNLKYARIWGSNKFNGQRVARDERLSDGDIIEFHI